MTDMDPEAEAFLGRLPFHLSAHGVSLPETVMAAWAGHFALLRRWNRTHNLTRIVDVDDAILKHYLDCALPLLDPTLLTGGGGDPPAVVDVGSGAGFPGLVAGMLWQGLAWQHTPWAGGTAPALKLVEPARKRQSFLQVAAKAVGVECQVVSPPAVPGALTGALVLTRATFSGGLRQTLWPYVAPGGTLVAWTTPHEASMWENEAIMWADARVTSHRCVIGGVDRRLAVVQRAIRATRGP